MKKIGLLINPLAGLGGPMGFKGSDGEAAKKALAMGAEPKAEKRTEEALKELLPFAEELEFYAPGGPMGEALLKKMGFSHTVIYRPGEETLPSDSVEATKALCAAGVELLLFAGGDGTARDLVKAAPTVPVVGIPAGVKIHSGVYAVNPKRAGEAAVAYLSGRSQGSVEREVMDIDESLFREGRVAASLYGYLAVPAAAGDCIQCTKAEGGGKNAEPDALNGMAAYVVDNMEKDCLYLIGPGSTTRAILEDMGLPCTLLGVDAVKNGELVASDLNEPAIWALLEQEERAKIVLTIIGGQGNLLGRGNQQFSPRILRKLGKKNLIVVSTREKLLGLDKRPLISDSGDAALDRELSGFVDVIVDYDQSIFYRLSD